MFKRATFVTVCLSSYVSTSGHVNVAAPAMSKRRWYACVGKLYSAFFMPTVKLYWCVFRNRHTGQRKAKTMDIIQGTFWKLLNVSRSWNLTVHFDSSAAHFIVKFLILILFLLWQTSLENTSAGQCTCTDCASSFISRAIRETYFYFSVEAILDFSVHVKKTLTAAVAFKMSTVCIYAITCMSFTKLKADV